MVESCVTRDELDEGRDVSPVQKSRSSLLCCSSDTNPSTSVNNSFLVKPEIILEVSKILGSFG